MRVRYSFSSRHTKRARDIKNIRKQKEKYPSLVKNIVENSDIILQILDSRFPEDSRNHEMEKLIKSNCRRVIFVLNKADLLKNKDKLRNKIKNELFPYVFTSCTKRYGVKELRNRIKQETKKVENPINKDNLGKITVGIIGYPNTGKSSLINLLIGKSSAGTGAEAGFTKGIQKIKLSENIVLLDTPGIIPEKEYSGIKKDLIAKHTKMGGRSHSQVKDPENVVFSLMKEHPNMFEEHYKVKLKQKNNVEELIEKLGRKKGFLKREGEVNEDKTARSILKDWQEGKIKI